ncbi:50S ribosomal protein L5 [Candidatus Peregrinibacteria bacterium HGW-Peregrinibacteria-1]|jgi:large subunit ribosomal protein L5|nr:ribosomal protein L5 [uncultured bacterium]PKL36313.1 MAG: 50S ribosomal protein L5 [Candidatus Peregrinibacteria bacterium HGW-Peregrinibacteria-1]
MAELLDLKTRFEKEIIPALKKELKLKNNMQVPKVKMVKLNVGIGTYLKSHGKDFQPIVDSITAITGQKPVVNKARMSVSNFKLREGEPVGISVTLRGAKMYHFLNKLVNIVFPRVRDFRGISPKSFDGAGNYTIGFKEHTVFPEISPDEAMKTHGLQIIITTTAQDDEQGRALLTSMGFPFKK